MTSSLRTRVVPVPVPLSRSLIKGVVATLTAGIVVAVAAFVVAVVSGAVGSSLNKRGCRLGTKFVVERSGVGVSSTEGFSSSLLSKTTLRAQEVSGRTLTLQTSVSIVSDYFGEVGVPDVVVDVAR